MPKEEVNFNTNNHNINKNVLDNKTSYKKFICENCNYYTSRKSQYVRHLDTNKHYKSMHQTTVKVSNNFTCVCGNSYLYKSGLYKHKKKCVMLNVNIKKVSNEELFL